MQWLDNAEEYSVHWLVQAEDYSVEWLVLVEDYSVEAFAGGRLPCTLYSGLCL